MSESAEKRASAAEEKLRQVEEYADNMEAWAQRTGGESSQVAKELREILHGDQRRLV